MCASAAPVHRRRRRQPTRPAAVRLERPHLAHRLHLLRPQPHRVRHLPAPGHRPHPPHPPRHLRLHPLAGARGGTWANPKLASSVLTWTTGRPCVARAWRAAGSRTWIRPGIGRVRPTPTFRVPSRTATTARWIATTAWTASRARSVVTSTPTSAMGRPPKRSACHKAAAGPPQMAASPATPAQSACRARFAAAKRPFCSSAAIPETLERAFPVTRAPRFPDVTGFRSAG